MADKPKINPYMLIMVAIISGGSASLMAKLMLNNGVPPIAMAFFRLFFASIIMLPFRPFRIGEDNKRLINLSFSKTNKADSIMGKKILFLPMLAGFLLACHFVLWFYSLDYTSLFVSTTMVNLQPVFMVFFAYLIFGEKTERFGLIAIAIAIGGSILMGLKDSSSMENLKNPMFGNALALISALCLCFYMICGRAIRHKIDLIPYTFMVYGYCSIFLFIAAIVTGTKLLGYDKVNYLLALGLAIFPTLLGHSIYNWAIKYVPSSVISMGFLAHALFSAVWGIIFFSQIPSTITIIGGAFVMSGIGWFAYLKGRQEKLRNT